MASKLQRLRYLFHELTEPPNPENLFLHVFSDAAVKAYGIVAYVRYYCAKQKRFLSKVIYSCTRIAPTKAKLSIPKKELNGLLLACQKAEYLRNILKINKENVYIHCDSLVSLYWVKHDPDKLKIYVSNRVRKIKDLATIYDMNNKKTHETHFQILHVPGSVNPADYVSKVTPPEKYVNNENWTMGTKFLKNDNEQILEEFAVDKISKNTKGNISENI